MVAPNDPSAPPSVSLRVEWVPPPRGSWGYPIIPPTQPLSASLTWQSLPLSVSVPRSSLHLLEAGSQRWTVHAGSAAT